MTKETRVVAAIPNYNMASSLKRLLNDLSKQPYDAIYVCDDASTDNSEQVAKSFKNVHFLKNSKNGGAGSARNLMLNKFSEPTYIHFLDADVRLATKNTPDAIQSINFDDKTAFVGGLTNNEDGHQTIWNYGSSHSLGAYLSGGIASKLEKFDQRTGYKNPLLGILHALIYRRPNPYIKQKRKRVFWVIEGNFVVRSDIFDRLGGFDETIREHDIHPYAAKAEAQGMRCYFDPSFCVTRYDAINVRHYDRGAKMWESEKYVVKHYLGGWLVWVFPFLRKRS